MNSQINVDTNKGKFVLDFSGSFCGPCKKIAPDFHKLKDFYPNITFFQIDIEKNPKAAMDYSINSVPTFIFIKDGYEVGRVNGANVKKLYDTTEHLSRL